MSYIDRPLPTMTTNLSQRTTVTLGIAAFVAICSSLVGATWRLNEWLNEQTAAIQRSEEKLDALRIQIADLRNNMWSIHDMNRWTGRARWENRVADIQFPEPSEWRDYRYSFTTGADPKPR